MSMSPSLRNVTGAAGLLAIGLAAGACDRGGDAPEPPAAAEQAAEQAAPSEPAAPAGPPVLAVAADLSAPVTASGTAGGAVNARETHTGTAPHTGCVGYMPAEPQHLLNIDGEQTLTVVANVQGTGDLTMAIVGPSGTWCNDDFEGLDPGLTAAFPTGEYRVFVGTFGAEQSFPYTLTVRPGPTAPETQTGALAPGFLPDPFTQDSVAGGPRSGHEWTGQGEHTVCRGSLPQEPQHVLTLEAFSRLKVTASPAPGQSGDLTMILEGPDGLVWCNDDFEGLDPGFDTAFPAGEYRVFVGVFGGGTLPYRLSVTEL